MLGSKRFVTQPRTKFIPTVPTNTLETDEHYLHKSTFLWFEIIFPILPDTHLHYPYTLANTLSYSPEQGEVPCIQQC